MDVWMSSENPDLADSNPFGRNTRYESYCGIVSAAGGSQQQDYWDFLYARYSSGQLGSAEEETNLLAGLGCSSNTLILSDYLDMNREPGEKNKFKIIFPRTENKKKNKNIYPTDHFYSCYATLMENALIVSGLL